LLHGPAHGRDLGESDRVRAADAPLRQWVLTVPHGLRAPIAYDRQLLPRLYRIFYSSIQRFYERRMAELGHRGGRTGSVTAIQRSSSDLRLNPHLHGVWLDGVYVQDAAGQLSWSPLPALSDRDVQEVLQTVIARFVAWLRRDGRLADDDTLAGPEADPGMDEQQLVLGALASAAVTGSSLARIIHEGARPRTTARLHSASAALENTDSIPFERRKPCEADRLRDHRTPS
jgi:hypothetical protein